MDRSWLPNGSRSIGIRQLVAFGLLVAAVVAFPLAGPAEAATCSTSAPGGGAYSVSLCLTVPNDGAVVAGDTPVTATVTITPSGATTVGKLIFGLDGDYLLTDYESPYTFTLPTTKFVDGTKQLTVTASLRDGFVTSPTSISMTFANSITVPPVNTNTFTPTAGTTPAPGEPFVLSAAGDGASGRTQADDVVNLVNSFVQPNLFLYLGDVYEKGTPTEFHNWYGPDGTKWGSLKSITDPVIGNHEYENGVAPGYFDYWDNVDDYYSFDSNGWHFIALNSNSNFGQTAPGTGQYDWLASDLAANTAECTVAYFHHPLLNIGPEGSATSFDPMWKQLADAGVDLVLTGHDHNYQRWTAVDRNYQPDPNGMTEFVLGASGHGVRPFVTSDSRVVASSDAVPGAVGAPRFELNPQGASFTYRNTAGQVLDSGVIPCNGTGADTLAPTTPSDFAAAAVGGPAVDLTWSRSNDNVGVETYTVFRDGEAVASVPGHLTQFTDTTVSPSTRYQYRVDAVDPAGNHSATSPPQNVTTEGYPTVVTSSASADTYVSGASPTSNYGSATLLRADTSPDLRSYLRFEVSGVTSPVVSATLRVEANANHSLGFVVQDVSDDSWNESTMTYTSAPSFGPAVGASGALTGGEYVEIPVTGVFTGDGTYSFALTALNSTALSLASRESLTPPELVIVQDVSGNLPPVAGPVSLTTEQDIGGWGAAWVPSVSDPDSADLTCTLDTDPAHGGAGVVSDCSVGLYVPDRGFFGTDSFTYRVSDGSLSATATVTVEVTPSGDIVAVASADTWVSASAAGTNYGAGTILRADTSPDKRSYLRFEVSGVTSPVVSATLRVKANANHSKGFVVQDVGDDSWNESTMTYTSAPSFGPAVGASGALSGGEYVEIPVTGVFTGDGTYSFALTALNSSALSLASRESLTPPELVIVQDVSGNQPPVAGPVSLTTEQDIGGWGAAWVPSVSDPDSADLTCTLDTDPAHGGAGVVSDCSVGLYVPAAGFHGTDSFTYRVSDGSLSATATVTVTVTPNGNLTVTAGADTYVSASSPSTNYGAKKILRADSSPDIRSYLRFDVSGFQGPVVSATLRIRSNSNHSQGFVVQDVGDDSWNESTMTYTSAPSFGPALGASGALIKGEYVEIPLTGVVTGDGTYSFALTALNSTALGVWGTTTLTPPELVITG